MLAAACGLVATAAAAEDLPAAWELRAEAQHDNLDHGQPDWREEMLQLAWKPRHGLAVLGGARATDRFDQHDTEAFAGAYLPLGARTGLHLEGSVSDTHHVLARDSVLGELSQQLGSGWVLGAAARYARYETGDVHAAIGTLEKYLGAWRLAYTAYLSQPQGSGWAPSHRLSATWYRNALTFATASAGRGREVENVFPTGLVTSDVRSAAIGGGIELVPRWGLTLDLGYVRQGDLYTRRFARLGTRILF